MNLGGKQDLDELLHDWPATPPKGALVDEERGWDERADAIVRAAEKAARDGAAKDAAEALFAAPALAPEAGEDAVVAAGEKKMSEEKESTRPPASTATPVPSQRRQSLKEIAARASQSGAARPSQAGASTPPPRASTPAPAPVSTPLPRPTEAGKDDSGVINLNVVHATATAQQHADAAKAKPAQESLFDEEKPAANATAAAKAANVTPLQPKKSNAGLIGGIAIAVVGIAAAFAIIARKPPPAPAPTAAVQQDKAPATATPAPSAAPAPATAAPSAVASAEPAATAEPDNKAADAPKGPAVAVGSGAATAGAASTADAKLAAKTPTPSGKPGDLQSEMAKAVGKDGAAKPDQPAGPTPEPAAGGSRNQNIPEQPSQGAIAAAFGPVMGGAKACVAGADDVSRATVTFSSAGTVTRVSVGGWAAANGKSGCVQAALKAAKVGPFSKPSFTVGVPIRP